MSIARKMRWADIDITDDFGDDDGGDDMLKVPAGGASMLAGICLAHAIATGRQRSLCGLGIDSSKAALK